MNKDWSVRLITVLPGLLLGSYILTRIFTVSITIDEPKTCLLYARYDVLSIMSNLNPDPNNHIFHTLLVKLFSSLFGLHQWSVRLPNFIGFILFYISGVLLLKKIITGKWLLLAGILLLFTNPYMLDFFGVARGYGLALGLMMTCIYFTVNFIETNYSKQLILSLFFCILAVYTQFPLINLFASLLLFLGVYYIFIKKQPLLNWLIPIVAVCTLGGLLYIPVKQLLNNNAIPTWGTNNFINDTVYTLLAVLKYNHAIGFISSVKTLAALLLAGLIIFALVLFIYRKKASALNYRFLLLFVFLFGGSVLFMVLQNKIFGTAYLLTRTALFLLPLYLLLTITAISVAQGEKKWMGFLLVIISLAGFIHFTRCANFNKTFEWTFNSSEKKVIHYLQQLHTGGQQYISLNAHWHFYPALEFYKKSYRLNWLEIVPYHENTHTNNAAMYYFTYTTEAPVINSCYTAVRPFANYSQVLFKCSRN